MKKTFYSIIALIGIVFMLGMAGCSERKEVSFDSLEDAKATARANSLWNAQTFRSGNPLYQNYDLISAGDSTQMTDCPQGDGWATLTLVSPNKAEKIGLKCSTVSAATGCMTDEDFKSKPFSNQDKQCQGPNVVPYPLPKIAK